MSGSVAPRPQSMESCDSERSHTSPIGSRSSTSCTCLHRHTGINVAPRQLDYPILQSLSVCKGIQRVLSLLGELLGPLMTQQIGSVALKWALDGSRRLCFFTGAQPPGVGGQIVASGGM